MIDYIKVPASPVNIRTADGFELDKLGALVRDNWNEDSYRRFYDQFLEYLNGGDYSPEFYVAVTRGTIIGFSALRQSMLAPGFWEFPWVVVHKDHQGRGVGEMLTDYALDVVRDKNGAAVLLVTQKPKFFNRFGYKTSQDHGNGWVQMTCQLKLVDMK